MWISRRKFLSKEIIVFAANSIDESKLISNLNAEFNKLDNIYDNVQKQYSTNELFKSDEELKNKLGQLKLDLQDLQYVLGGMFVTVNEKPRIVLDWVKGYYKAVEESCNRILELFNDDKFTKNFFKDPDVGNLNAKVVVEVIKGIKKNIDSIHDRFADMQMIQRTPEEEQQMWLDYTQQYAEPNEAPLLIEQLKNLFNGYIETFGDDRLIRQFMSQVPVDLRDNISNTHSLIMHFVQHGAKSETMRRLTKQISSLLKNSFTYAVMKDNEDYQKWLRMLDNISIYGASFVAK